MGCEYHYSYAWDIDLYIMEFHFFLLQHQDLPDLRVPVQLDPQVSILTYPSKRFDCMLRFAFSPVIVTLLIANKEKTAKQFLLDTMNIINCHVSVL